MKFVLVLLAVFGSNLCFAEFDFNNTNDVRALLDDIHSVEQGVRNYEVKPDVCFEEIGCFSKTNGILAFMAANPESPEVIGSAFHLYSRQNKDTYQKISYLDKDTLSSGFFDGDRDTLVIIHGFNENAKKDWNLGMKNAALAVSDLNVIIVEWGNGAILPFYGQAIVNSEVVARELARLLELLQERRGLQYERTYVVGYSLGAHLAGFTGKALFQKTGHKLARITGLDPAGPIFEKQDEKVHLSTNDATFVDIIHTSTGGNLLYGELGIEKAIGHVDFYPNAGKNQPGCGIFSLVCSHRRSVELFWESMTQDLTKCAFVAKPCKEGYTAFKNGKCSDSPDAPIGVMGISSIAAEGRGTLYLTTDGYSPYCKP